MIKAFSDKDINIYFPGTPISRGEDFFFGNFIEITRWQKCKFGNHSAIDSFFYSTVPLDIGDYIHIAPHVSVIGGGESKFIMDHFSFVATGTRIICGSEDYTKGGLLGATIPKEYRALTKIAPVTFERFSGCGAGCVILPGITIGEGSMIGAGSVVTKSTEPWGIYVGSPAKLVKFIEPKDRENKYELAAKMGYDFSNS